MLASQNAALLAAILALLQGLATGAASDFKDMGPVSYLAWGRWFGEAFYITGMHPLLLLCKSFSYGIELNLGRFTPAQADRIRHYIKYDNLKLDLENRNVDWAVLALYGLGLRLLAYVTFRVLYRSKQR